MSKTPSIPTPRSVLALVAAAGAALAITLAVLGGRAIFRVGQVHDASAGWARVL